MFVFDVMNCDCLWCTGWKWLPIHIGGRYRHRSASACWDDPRGACFV